MKIAVDMEKKKWDILPQLFLTGMDFSFGHQT